MPLLFVCKDSDKALMHQTSFRGYPLAKGWTDRVNDPVFRGYPLAKSWTDRVYDPVFRGYPLAKGWADRVYDPVGKPLGRYDDLCRLGDLSYGEEDVRCRYDDLCTVGL